MNRTSYLLDTDIASYLLRRSLNQLALICTWKRLNDLDLFAGKSGRNLRAGSESFHLNRKTWSTVWIWLIFNYELIDAVVVVKPSHLEVMNI